MRIALRYIAAPVLASSVAVVIAAATASATAETQPARSTDASTASPDHGGVYCGQFCGTYNAYSNQPDGAAAPASYGVGRSRLNPLSPVLIRLPIVDDAGALVPQH
jgi:hypothetical protein